MKKHCPFFASTFLIAGLSTALLLSACQGSVLSTSTMAQTETSTSVPVQESSAATASSTVSEATTTAAPQTETAATTILLSPTPTQAPQDLKLKVTLEKLTENFVVWDGEEIIDEYSGSYMYQPVIVTQDPEVTALIEMEIKEKMSRIHEYWGRFVTEKAAALADKNARVSVVLRADLQVDTSNGIHSIFSRFLYGGYRSEYSPAEYFSINIDSRDGHVIALDELLLRMKISASEIANKANTVLKEKGGVYGNALVKPGDVKEGRLFYDGKTLQLLVPVEDPNFMGFFEELIDLGPVN